jgi:hypothetical protein
MVSLAVPNLRYKPDACGAEVQEEKSFGFFLLIIMNPAESLGSP